MPTIRRSCNSWHPRPTRSAGCGSGSGSGGPNDPLIKALIQRLPSGSSWPVDDRINWLKMLVMGFQVAYGTETEIEIKKAAN